MFESIREWFGKLIQSRLFIFMLIIVVLFIVVIQRLFSLQIIHGEEYLNNYTLSIEKEISIDGTRGSIYDRNGVLLAHNELSYTITLEDNGTYANPDDRPKLLNAEINTLIDMIESNGDSIVNNLTLYMDPDGNLSFLEDGTLLQGFRRDIYGRASIDDLVYNEELGYSEASATPEQMYEYLLNRFAVDKKLYGRYRAYQIMVIRYALSLNSFQRYLAIDVAQDVSEQTVAMVKEHSAELQGVEVKEDTKRVYDNPEYFSNIIGYTGTISADEYEKLSKEDNSYTQNDVVGKSGIESVMELQLQGKKGHETVYVNSLGKILKTKEHKDSAAGNDVYLSIDANLQMAVYDLIEQELAGIICSKLINEKYSNSSELYIPIYDVYGALFENNVIDSANLALAQPDTVQAKVYQAFVERQPHALEDLAAAMRSDKAFDDLSDEMQEYITFVVTYLQDQSVFMRDAVDTEDETYLKWRNGDLSVKNYLTYAIEQSWMDISSFRVEEKYSDAGEVYENLISYVTEQMQTNRFFDRIIYKYMVFDDRITPRQLCLILFEQGVLNNDEKRIQGLKNGTIGSYAFIKDCIQNLELTPAQLALDPCTGSCVIMNPNTGELLACVTYPGYDNNRLANSMDSRYYNNLLKDQSNPLYNNATQQTTAPGSTFKMVSAAAGLTEGVIDTSTVIEDKGTYDKLGMDLHCWIYPSSHGKINIAQAIRDSCNYFFCEVGYRLSLNGTEYSEAKGVKQLGKYAEEFGLSDKTGLEIPESDSNVADELPISAAIGQSNNSYTTAQLCRYVASVANMGTVYNLTILNKVTDINGNVLEDYQPRVRNEITDLSPTTWNTIRQGMQMAIGEHSEFKDLKVALAGKTGTAQENENRPNHALFVGFAPCDNPEIAIATRIAYGYTSNNACDLADKILKYYFKEEDADKLLNGKAADVGASSNAITD